MFLYVKTYLVFVLQFVLFSMKHYHSYIEKVLQKIFHMCDCFPFISKVNIIRIHIQQALCINCISSEKCQRRLPLHYYSTFTLLALSFFLKQLESLHLYLYSVAVFTAHSLQITMDDMIWWDREMESSGSLQMNRCVYYKKVNKLIVL